MHVGKREGPALPPVPRTPGLDHVVVGVLGRENAESLAGGS